MSDVPLGWLRHEDTIAVNYMGRQLPEPTYFLTADSGVIRNAVTQNWFGMPTTTKKVVVINPEEHPRWGAVKEYVPQYDTWVRPTRWDGSLVPSGPDFATGKNTGFCALQFAVQLGYKDIYLMGVDLQTVNGRKYCYEPGGNASPYDQFLRHFIAGVHRCTDYGINVYSCSPISPLNGHIKFVPWQRLVPRMPVFVSHYTVDTPYEQEVKNLEASLCRWGLDYWLEGIYSLGTWRANSNYCATQVQKALGKFEPRAICRVDADAIIQKRPDFFERPKFKADVAAAIWKDSKLRPGGELMGGTMYFGNTPRCREVIEGWLERIAKRPHGRNPDLLMQELNRTKCDFKELPLSYCRIFDFPAMGNEIVIEHFQGSRKWKKLMNLKGPDPCAGVPACSRTSPV